jgi:hypothetical protein
MADDFHGELADIANGIRECPARDLPELADQLDKLGLRMFGADNNRNDEALTLAHAAMERAMGKGADEAHRAMTNNPAAKRIYDCAIQALAGFITMEPSDDQG